MNATSILRNIGCAIAVLTLAACAYSPAEREPPRPSPISQPSQPSQPSGEVNLAWDEPDQRLSGSRLEPGDIESYRIYYGSSPNEYDEVLEVEADTPLPHTVSGLEPGERYYFSISAVDEEGRESPRSTPIELLAEQPDQETTQASAER